MHISKPSAALLLISVSLGALAAGCSRTKYRLSADQEAYATVAEKYTDPRWVLQDYTIEIDPRSRYFDPYDPDRPPMPPDDPAAHEYMEFVDGMRGWPKWHCNGDRIELENPAWREGLIEYVRMNENQEYVLSLDSALELAYVHSPNYQQQVETLFLSALDVTTERFRLETQFFGGFDTDFEHRGDKTIAGLFNPSRVRPEQDRLTLSGNGGGAGGFGAPGAGPASVNFTRRFATAGTLVAGFANSFVWEFTSGDANFTSSLLNFSLVQPLLRGAGRDIGLEQLTIVERGLLGNLRALQRYRRGFYTNVAVGQLGVQGPSRRGGFLGGTGLTGFTGQGAGGLGGVGAATGFGGFFGGGAGTAATGAGLAGGGAGTVGGFIGLLQQLQQIRNTQDSLALQLRTLSLLEAYLEGGVIDLVQVDQFRQNIETERALLLQDTNGLQDAVERYLTGTLGLPPDLPVSLDDSLIEQFQLIDPLATELQNEIGLVQDRLGDLPAEVDPDALNAILAEAGQKYQAVGLQLNRIATDVDGMEDVSETRRRGMTPEEQALYQREKQQLHDGTQELRETYAALESRLAELEQGIRSGNIPESVDGLVVWVNDLYRLTQVSMLIQARARVESVVIDPIRLDSSDAFQIALQNRLDLMNSRASLVDSWRLIQFNADALQATVDVVFEGDMGTTRNNPLSFDGSTGSLRAGVQFDAPLTRLLERNNYRQSLIDYQQSRRQFIQLLDGVHSTMRQTLRSLLELETNLEIQRRAVAIAIRRVDLTREELNEPVPPAEPGQPAPALGPTAAQNLLTALSDLRNTQNNFMSVWLNYYATRMQLMRDLGIMVIDERGHWVDEPIPDFSPYGAGEQVPMPPPVPSGFFAIAEAIAPGQAADDTMRRLPPVALQPETIVR